jgi:hypothetical protein
LVSEAPTTGANPWVTRVVRPSRGRGSGTRSGVRAPARGFGHLLGGSDKVLPDPGPELVSEAPTTGANPWVTRVVRPSRGRGSGTRSGVRTPARGFGHLAGGSDKVLPGPGPELVSEAPTTGANPWVTPSCFALPGDGGRDRGGISPSEVGLPHCRMGSPPLTGLPHWYSSGASPSAGGEPPVRCESGRCRRPRPGREPGRDLAANLAASGVPTSRVQPHWLGTQTQVATEEERAVRSTRVLRLCTGWRDGARGGGSGGGVARRIRGGGPSEGGRPVVDITRERPCESFHERVILK